MFIEGVSRDRKRHLGQVSVTEGRLDTNSVTTTDVLHAVGEGRAFQIYTLDVNFGSDLKQMMLFIENGNDKDMIVTSATIGSGASADGVDNIILLEQVGNISPADPIVTAGTDVTARNRNSGSPTPYVGDIKKGPQAVSGNEVAVNGVRGDFTGAKTFDLTAQIPKGGSLGVAITPPAGNTSMNVTITIALHVME